MKKIMVIIAVIVTLAVFIDVGASFYFYKIAVSRSPKEFLYDTDELEAAVAINSGDIEDVWLENGEFKDIEISSYDGLKLHGYFLEAKIPTNNTVIIVHGYSGSANVMVSYAEFYYQNLGYNVLMPDNRGHGKSEGNYIGFGWHDRMDYLNWIDYVINNIGDNSNIVLHGVSMGGATVLMTSGENLPNNVKAIISDCAYTSVMAQLTYQLKRMYNIPTFPIMQSTSLLTKIRAGYFFSEASALDQVAKSKTPTLFIHGDADTFVPYEMVFELYDNCSSEKELFIVPGAEHAMAYWDDTIGYETKVKEFLKKHVPLT